jgi:hypothetical protein
MSARALRATFSFDRLTPALVLAHQVPVNLVMATRQPAGLVITTRLQATLDMQLEHRSFQK